MSSVRKNGFKTTFNLAVDELVSGLLLLLLTLCLLLLEGVTLVCVLVPVRFTELFPLRARGLIRGEFEPLDLFVIDGLRIGDDRSLNGLARKEGDELRQVGLFKIGEDPLLLEEERGAEEVLESPFLMTRGVNVFFVLLLTVGVAAADAGFLFSAYGLSGERDGGGGRP